MSEESSEGLVQAITGTGKAKRRPSTSVLRKAECANCNKVFEYRHTTGAPHKHCSIQCRRWSARKRKNLRMAELPECLIEGCDKRANRVRTGLCEMHYCRQWRTGSVQRKPTEPKPTDHGYMRLADRSHPLARGGSVYMHRKVAYEMHKGECPNCYWCNTEIDWSSCHIDHLNGQKKDNRPENLAVTCVRCNRLRGSSWPFLVSLSDEKRKELMVLASQQHQAA